MAQLNFKIKNNGSRPCVYHLAILPQSFQLISKLPQSITVAPQDSLILPVKMYVPKKSVAGIANLVQLTITPDDTLEKPTQCAVVIYVNPKKEIYIAAIQQDLYLHNNNNLTFDLRCTNVGNVGSVVNLVLTDAFPQTKIPLTISFFIPGFTDTVIHITYQMPGAVSQIKNTQLKVTGAYADSAIFSTVLVNVYNTNSQQKYITNDLATGNTGAANMLGLYSRYIGAPYQYYEMAANGSVPLSVGSGFKYNADALYYPNAAKVNNNANNYIMLVNTYAAYNDSTWGIKAGSIFENLEAPIFGRGVEAQVNIRPGASFEAGYVNANYNLAGPIHDTNYQYANTAFATYSDVLFNMAKLKTQFIQCWDPQNKDNYTIGGGSIAIPLLSQHQLAIGAYGSYSTTKPYLAASARQYGQAGFLQYTGVLAQWQLLSSNYLSSRQYAGLQRGAINLEEKIMYSGKNNWNGWVRYSKYSNSPEYISPEYQLLNNTTYYTETAELGFQKRLNDKMAVSVKPYYYQEYNKLASGYFLDSQSIRSGRMDATLNYSGFKNQSISVDADMGAYTTNLFPNSNLCWKINATYQYKQFTCNTFLQNGPYFAGQVYQYPVLIYPLTNKPYKLYSFSPGYTGLLFKKATVSANDFISYDYIYQHWTNNIMVHTSYPLPKNFTLEVNYNRLPNGFYKELNTFDVGFVKRFSKSAYKNQSKGKLEIVFFEDINGDSKYENGEHLMKNILVKINDELFWTDDDGTITYNDIPGGNYQVTIVNGNGFYANTQSVFVNGKTRWQVPMHKMGAIKGKLSLLQEELSYDIDGNIAGIRINAIDKQGKTISAITNEQGEFTFYLPEDSYSIQVDVPTLPEKYECPDFTKLVTVTTAPSDLVRFNISVQKRQLKIKKFSSIR